MPPRRWSKKPLLLKWISCWSQRGPFYPPKRWNGDDPNVRPLTRAAAHDLAIWSPHTAFDASLGWSDGLLRSRLGVANHCDQPDTRGQPKSHRLCAPERRRRSMLVLLGRFHWGVPRMQLLRPWHRTFRGLLEPHRPSGSQSSWNRGGTAARNGVPGLHIPRSSLPCVRRTSTKSL